MSYRIEYGPDIPPQYREKSTSGRLQTMICVFLLLFALLVRQFFPAGTMALRTFLLPGSPSVTQQALDELVRDVHDGEAFGDAFTAFCEQIISHDQALLS